MNSLAVLWEAERVEQTEKGIQAGKILLPRTTHDMVTNAMSKSPKRAKLMSSMVAILEMELLKRLPQLIQGTHCRVYWSCLSSDHFREMTWLSGMGDVRRSSGFLPLNRRELD